MRLLTVYLPEFAIEKLDALVKRGLYPNRAEAIRCAVHDLIQQELTKELADSKVSVDVKEKVVEIRENGQTFTVEIERNSKGAIWGVYPNRVPAVTDEIIFPNAMRNLLILFRKGILKLEDFPRPREKEA
jgi:Arc/MetJ-type ribon-helix-helix transcriptional regulator